MILMRRTKVEILIDAAKIAGMDFDEILKLRRLVEQRQKQKRTKRIKEYQEIYKVSDENYSQVMTIEVDNEIHYGTPLSIGATQHWNWINCSWIPASELRYSPLIGDTGSIEDEYQFHKLIYKSLAEGKKKRRYATRQSRKIRVIQANSKSNCE